MLREGDRVSLIGNMHKIGVVTQIEVVQSDTTLWLVGGTSSNRILCSVKFDNGEQGKYFTTDLRKEY
jgi:hypothetical protein